MTALVIICAKYLIALPVLIALYVAWQLPAVQRMRLVILAACSLPLAYVIAKILSHFYYDPRPFVVNNFTPLIAHAPDNGFPSDHMLLAASIAAVITVVRPRAGFLLWIIAIIVGAARVLAGVHHIRDISGSVIVSIIAVAIVVAVMRSFRASPLE